MIFVFRFKYKKKNTNANNYQNSSYKDNTLYKVRETLNSVIKIRNNYGANNCKQNKDDCYFFIFT